jgi:hypothetical protein
LKDPNHTTMRLYTSLLLWTSLLAACVRSSEPTGTPLAVTRETAVMIEDVNDPGWPKDHITLDSAVVSGDRVRLFTKYGGGCSQDHAAALLVSRAFMESYPPVLRARIAHDGKNDQCKALVGWTLEFDLKPVRDHYRQSYQSNTGALVLDIGGQRVTYDFR